ncbi:hypothetical protein [Corynebacterium diphtheriae]|uniref:hypothetical protein n=1 Tax=Corynebacterium diphtheriae TaxID=1717 RepID=UPI001ED8F398|nr:hypothetical protein [Corynebacterium diphtheriae]
MPNPLRTTTRQNQRTLKPEGPAKAVGINPREALDIDKGVTKLNGVGRVPRVSDGPDTELYKRLMQVVPYVDGRQAVPVEVIPQHAIDKRMSPR